MYLLLTEHEAKGYLNCNMDHWNPVGSVSVTEYNEYKQQVQSENEDSYFSPTLYMLTPFPNSAFFTKGEEWNVHFVKPESK